jgi:hypothetical protein
MQTFTYPLVFRWLYRYGNIPANLLLLFYLYISASAVQTNFLSIIPLIILMFVMYALNKHYIMMYQILPYKIEADEEKITAKDFFLSRKNIVIYYSEISDLKGGIFDGRISGVMKVHHGPTKRIIGFFNKLKNVDKLQTIILSKVNRSVYDAVIERVGLKKEKKK